MSPSRRRTLALWAVGYLGLLACVSWPLLSAPGELVPLTPTVPPDMLPGDGDPWNFLWRIDWLWRHPWSLVELAPRTDDIFRPFGLELTMLRGMALQGLVAIGLRPLGNLVLAHNVIWALSFLLTGLTTARLAEAISGSRAGAFAAGALVAFGPPFYAHSLGHSYKYLAFALVPLALLALWRFLEEGRERSLATLGAVSAGVVLSDWYNALYVALAALVLVAARVGRVPARLLARRVAALVMLAIPLAGVLAWSLAPVLAARAATLTATVEEQAAFSVDLLTLVLPPSTHGLWGAWAAGEWSQLAGNESEKTAFLGWVLPLTLAVLAWHDRGDRRVRLWGVLAAVFLVLALGPWLQWNGERLLRLPGYWLGQVPGLAGSRAPGRYVLMAHLALAVVMAVLVARRRHPGRVAGLLVLLMAIEFAPFATPVAPYRPSPALGALAGVEGAVLDVPYRFHSGLYTALQTQHRRPLVGGYLIRVTPRYAEYPQGVPGFDLLRDPLGASPPTSPDRLHSTLWRLLEVRWVVLHKRYLDDPREAAARLRAAGLPLETWQEDETVMVMRLAEPPAASPLEGPQGWTPAPTAPLVTLGWTADPAGHLWGDAAPRLALAPPPGARALELEVLSYRATVTRASQELRIEGAGSPVAATLGPGWQPVEIPVPSSHGPPWVLSLGVDRPARPADLEPPSPDRRRLSVALRRLRWRD